MTNTTDTTTTDIDRFYFTNDDELESFAASLGWDLSGASNDSEWMSFEDELEAIASALYD